jgi:hypothetical protein
MSVLRLSSRDKADVLTMESDQSKQHEESKAGLVRDATIEESDPSFVCPEGPSTAAHGQSYALP